MSPPHLQPLPQWVRGTGEGAMPEEKKRPLAAGRRIGMLRSPRRWPLTRYQGTDRHVNDDLEHLGNGRTARSGARSLDLPRHPIRAFMMGDNPLDILNGAVLTL